MSWAVHRFKKRLAEELNGVCPSCQKKLEYEELTRRSLMRHIDRDCVSMEEDVDESVIYFTSPDEGVLSNVQLPGAIDKDDNSSANGHSDREMSDSEDEGSDEASNEDGFVIEWEQDFLDNGSAVQIGGARMTGAQIRANLSKKINSNITLAQLLYNILSKDEPVHVKERSLEVARLAAADGSIIPPSIHLVRRALQLRSLQSTSIHICSQCCRYAWKPIPKEDWPQCADDCECSQCTCPVCKESNGVIAKRFNKDNKEIKPNLRCYYLGVRKSIQRLFATEEFRRAKKLRKPYDKIGSWWNSSHALWVNEVTGGKAETNEEMMEGGDMLGEAFIDDNGIYSLHFDWVQGKRVGKEPYSIGLVTLRCDSVDEAFLNKDEWGIPLMVIPGPREPISMDICWKIIADDFQKCELGIPIQYRENGEIQTFTHKPFLVRVCCDACARHKILKDMTATAVHPCPWCKMESCADNRSCIMGYCKPSPSKRYDWDALLTLAHRDIDREALIDEMWIQIGETDPTSYRITLEEHKQRSAILETMSTLQLSNVHKSKVKKILGISGKCNIAWQLKTLHPLNFVYLPVYHLLVLGLVKNDCLWHMYRPELKNVASQHEAISPNLSCMRNFQKAREKVILNCDVDERCIDLQTCSTFLVSNTLA